MDGLLLIDKPAGPTSHDVVARMRRTLREKRIGHTGTLDPAATGVLALVLGRATRLAQFLSASDKSYDAVVRLGFSTDTADARGRATGSVRQGPFPSPEAIDAALDAFRGTFLQQPPAFSAKRIDGTRSHKLARAHARAQVSDTAVAALPAPARVTAHAIEILGCEGDLVTLRVDCSAGFYVRSLAHDLGERLGTGAHLASLRRTRSGALTLSQALDLDIAERDPRRAEAAIIPLADMLPELTAVVLNSEGVVRAVHGRELGPGDWAGDLSGLGIRDSGLTIEGESRIPSPESHRPLIRLLDLAGHLVGIAVPAATPGLLHPSIVLM
jgi:tRNA pseudouridine55 synthase